MSYSRLSRRSVLLSPFLLAACFSGGDGDSTNRVLTNAYDGEYKIVVSRLWNDTPSNRADPFYKTEPEELALLSTAVSGGRFDLTRVENRSDADAYGDFRASIYGDGTLEMSTTVGYLLSEGKTDVYRLTTAARIGDQLLLGNWVSFEPSGGYSVEYRPYISIRKVR